MASNWRQYDHLLEEFIFRMHILGYEYREVQAGWQNLYRALALAIRGDETLWEQVEANVTRQLARRGNWALDLPANWNNQLRDLITGGNDRHRQVIAAAAVAYRTTIIIQSDDYEGIFPQMGFFGTTVVLSFLGGHFAVLVQEPVQQN